MRHPSLAHNDPTFESKSRSTLDILKRVLVYLKPYKGMAAATIACAVLSLAFSFVLPRATSFIIDEIIGNQRVDLLAPTMIGLIGAFFLSDWFNSLRIRLNNTFEQNVVYDMRRDVYGKLQRLPVRYFDQRASGDLMTRVIEDVNAVERVLIDGTEQGSVAILSIIGVSFFLFSMNPTLAIVALAPFPMLIGGALWYTLTAHKRYRHQRRAASAMNALLMDNLQGNRQIKAFGREKHEDRRFRDRADDLRQGTMKVMLAWSIYSPAMNFATFLGTGLVLWFGSRHVIAGTMTQGELVSFLFFLALFYEPIRKLHGLNQLLQAARAGGERVFDILDAERERPGALQLKPFPKKVEGRVCYKHVGFHYDEGRKVLEDINIRAEPGEMIALVGPTGAGKSTFVNLLPAFYELSEGQITIDGFDIREIQLESLRNQIAVVSQEPFLFNGTVRENILYGNLDASDEQVISAAVSANCHEFISRLSEGFDTHVGERGVKLSVGEKQRISIARALLKDAPILILDEATASVDTATEKLIQDALHRLMRGRTSFVIAHRLSTIREADKILVIQKGRIQEQGTHEQLLNNNGLYAQLCRVQNTTFIEEGFERMVLS